MYPMIFITRLLADLPPVHIVIADCDVLCEQNILLGERLKSAGIEVEAIIYPGTTHSFLEAISIATVAERAVEVASRWMERITAS